MKTSKFLSKGIILWSLLFLSACGSGIEVAPGNTLPNVTPPNGTPQVSPTPVPPKLTEVTPNAFNIGSLYPADLDIVNQPGIQNVAFITTSFPGSVIAVDLNSNPLTAIASMGLSSLRPGSGIPNNLFVVDATHAFLLTSSAVIYFNPSDSNPVTSIYQTLDLTGSITLTANLAQVDANGNSLPDINKDNNMGNPNHFIPSFPASMVFAGNKLAVSFSNVFFVGFSLDHAVQGVVRWFNINTSFPYLSPSTTEYVATSGFNLTGLTLLPNGNVLATNTGVTKFTPDFSNQLPVTPGSVDLMDFNTVQNIGTVDLGMTSPAFQAWAVTPDGSKAFIGSATGGYVLEVGLNPFTVLRGESNPIVVTNAANGTDFLDSVVMGRLGGGIFPMSFNNSKVFAVDLTALPPVLIADSIDLTDPSTPGVTGAGPGALRPGTPGVDFSGPDLFVLTGNPGTMAAIKTY